MMEVDGSIGEGGGQILRTSVALSALTQKPIIVKNIRAKRDKPGLRNQHMTAIKGVAAIVDADVDGLELGSSEITFAPKRWKGGEFTFDIGTAGSTTLVLQALLPVLAFSKRHSNVTLIGGTNNPMAPQIDYFIHVLNPVLSRMGFTYELTLVRRGFYPRGGGLITVSVEPISSIEPINIVEVGSLDSIHGISHSTRLPKHVAYRQAVARKSTSRVQGTLVQSLILRRGRRAMGFPLEAVSFFGLRPQPEGSSEGMPSVNAENLQKR